MSKKSTKSRPKRSRAKVVQAPAGLSAAFKLIAIDWTAIGAQHHATEAYPHALRVIDVINNERDRGDVAMQERLDDAARAMFGPSLSEDDPAKEPNLIAFASFYVGFAVCWLQMTRVNGGVR